MVTGSSEDVLVEERGHLGILTLNRPRAANALTESMVQTLWETLTRWSDDARIEQVLITGAGERGLCAGGDIVGIYHDLKDARRTGRARLATESFWRSEYRLNVLINEYPKPYIAYMDGLTLGGGIGVSAHGSHRVVTERTRAGMPETTIGFVPDVGGTHLLSQAPGHLGTYAALTGAHLNGPDALALGLADVIVASDRLPQLTEDLTQHHVDDILRSYTHTEPESQLLTLRPWIDETFAPTQVEDIQQQLHALKEHDDAATDFAEETLAMLASKSPTSLKLTRELIHQATTSPGLRAALQREFLVAMRLCASADFIEGVRAQVIDKDRSPQWSPPALEDVTTEAVESYFQPDQQLTLVLD